MANDAAWLSMDNDKMMSTPFAYFKKKLINYAFFHQNKKLKYHDLKL